MIDYLIDQEQKPKKEKDGCTDFDAPIKIQSFAFYQNHVDINQTYHWHMYYFVLKIWIN